MLFISAFVFLTPALCASHFFTVDVKSVAIFNMVLSTAVAVNPNVQKDYAELPAMGKASWNGIPSTDFLEKFFEPLCMALGSVSENANFYPRHIPMMLEVLAQMPTHISMQHQHKFDIRVRIVLPDFLHVL